MHSLCMDPMLLLCVRFILGSGRFFSPPVANSLYLITVICCTGFLILSQGPNFDFCLWSIKIHDKVYRGIIMFQQEYLVGSFPENRKHIVPDFSKDWLVHSEDKIE